MKEIIQHWLDLPASIISKYRSSDTALHPTMNKYIIYTQVWTSIWRFVSLCDEQTTSKAFEKQGIISVESITWKKNFLNLRCLATRESVFKVKYIFLCRIHPDEYCWSKEPKLYLRTCQGFYSWTNQHKTAFSLLI